MACSIVLSEKVYNKISNCYEQLAILEVCINSKYYTGTQKDLTEMQIEWSAHNFMHILTEPLWRREIIESVPMFEEAHTRSGSVDIKGIDTLQTVYKIVTFWGFILW